MVGKPNLPEDADQRTDLRGMAMPTEGLTALDQEREASMADEGGASGAWMESQEPRSEAELMTSAYGKQEQRIRRVSRRGFYLVASALAVIGGSIIYARRVMRPRSWLRPLVFRQMRSKR
ncbi:MAG: hypothetical protein AB2A00_17995 [Myxococcota bacterium]